MNKIKVFLIFLLALVVTGLAACNNDKADNIKVDVVVTPHRDSVSVNIEFLDPDKRIFSSVKPVLYIYEYEDEKQGDEVDSEQLELEEGTSVDINTKAEVVNFTDLDELTPYYLRLEATIESYNYTLYETSFETTNEGSSEETAIVINNKDDFLNVFAYDTEGYYKLGADIDFENSEIKPLFTSVSQAFKGSLDGDGHTLKNFKISSNNQYSGLFGYNEGTIKNLIIDNMTLTVSRSSSIYAGLLVGWNKGVVDNCTVKNSSLDVETTTYSILYNFNVGGLVGYVDGSKEGIKVINSNLENVTLEADAVLAANVGGFIGIVQKPKSARTPQEINNNNANVNMTINLNVKTNTKEDVYYNIGGFVGSLARTISNSTFTGNIDIKAVKSSAATYEAGLEVYNLNVGGFAGELVPNSTSSLNNVKATVNEITKSITNEDNSTIDKVVSAINVEATPVYNVYVGALVGNTNDGRINGEANVVSMTVLGYNEENKEENVTYSINVGSLFGNRDYNEKDEASNNDIKINITCYKDYLKQYNGRQVA